VPDQQIHVRFRGGDSARRVVKLDQVAVDDLFDVLALLALRFDLRRSSTPRCGDCGLRMSAASGTCPACGGRRG
jgi:tRNA(Ile2) C34 agmatinyltransferase TiaS